MTHMNTAPVTPLQTEETLIYGQFDSEPTWLARQNMAADAALRHSVETADFERDTTDDLPFSA